MISPAEIEEFVRPDYEGKDIMHNLAHIKRVESLARQLGHTHDYDAQLIMLGAYLHGVIYFREAEARQFLVQKQLPPDAIEKAVRIAWESQTDGEPQSIEGILLHDAHLLEGGKTFIIVKSLVTGTARGQTLEATLGFIEQKVLGQFRCYLPEAQTLYEQKEAYTRSFLEDLKRNL